MVKYNNKHKSFVVEPMSDKPVTALAGIGEALGGRLIEAGFDKAFTVLGQYLLVNKDEELFKEWLKDACKASSKQASDCYNCLHHWGEEFL